MHTLQESQPRRDRIQNIKLVHVWGKVQNFECTLRRHSRIFKNLWPQHTLRPALVGPGPGFMRPPSQRPVLDQGALEARDDTQVRAVAAEGRKRLDTPKSGHTQTLESTKLEYIPKIPGTQYFRFLAGQNHQDHGFGNQEPHI